MDRSDRGRQVTAARRVVSPVVAAALAGVAVVYAGRLGVGLFYDDYHFARPWSAIELRRVWFGSWDPAGIESVFFRPLASWFFAARFWLFGLDATAMHVASAAGHVGCALLVAAFVWRETANRGASAFAAWLYAVHPLFPYAQVSWLTNQMHLMQSLLCIMALLAWQRLRDRPWACWSLLGVIAVVMFLIKEDGVMLLPAMIALTIARAVVIRRRLPDRLIPILLFGVAMVAALVFWRFIRLGSLGGYGMPDAAQGVANLSKGLRAALALWPTRGPWQALASTIALVPGVPLLWLGGWRPGKRWLTLAGATIIILLALNLVSFALPKLEPYPTMSWPAVASGVLLAIGIWGTGAALWRRDRVALSLIVCGIALAVCFDVPFYFVSKREQYHLLGLGAVLASTGAVAGLVALARDRMRSVVLGALVVATLPVVVLARETAADFLPCAPGVLTTDRDVIGWWTTPPEITAWLNRKAVDCARGATPQPLQDVPIITWLTYDNHGVSRWTADRSVLLVRPAARSIALALRRLDATTTSPVRVTVRPSDGRSVEVTLDSPAWGYATVQWRTSLLFDLRGGELITVDTDPWFVPARRDRSSTDVRRFGVEIKVVTPR